VSAKGKVALVPRKVIKLHDRKGGMEKTRKKTTRSGSEGTRGWDIYRALRNQGKGVRNCHAKPPWVREKAGEKGRGGEKQIPFRRGEKSQQTPKASWKGVGRYYK